MGSSESSFPMDEGESSNETNNQLEVNQDSSEDPWWWEIENQNLLLDVVNNENDDVVDSGTVPSTSASAIASNNCEILSTKSIDNESLIDQKMDPNESDKNIYCDEDAVDEINKNVQKEQSLEEFKEELKTKRMARQTAVNDLREELKSLRKQLAEERGASGCSKNFEEASEEVQSTSNTTINEKIKKKQLEESDRAFAQQIIDDEVVSESTNPKVQLAEAQLALQMANAENLSLHTELGVTRKQVVSLKEVVTCCKQMIAMKEEQVVQLKDKLNEIEDSLAERELKIMSDNLRQEYDRQLANMRTLRQLYEERARVAAAERENLERQIAIKKDELEVEKGKTKKAELRCAGLEKDVETVTEELQNLKEQCSEHRFENKTLKEEMGAVNKLFSQMLMGFNGTNNLDIDRLTTMLEENRTLLNDMATKEATFDGAILPKLLFELVQQASVASIKPSEIQSSFNSSSSSSSSSSAAAATGNKNNLSTVDGKEQEEAREDEKFRDLTKYCSGLTADASATALSETASVHAPHPSSVSVVPLLSTVAYTTVGGMPTTEANISSNGNAERTTRGGRYETTNNTTATTNNDESLHDDEQQRPIAVAIAEKQKQQEEVNLNHNQPRVIAKVASAEEIIGNLPKVWKVLMELLSHHKIERVQFKENGHSEECFKSVQTPNGPKAELSVSKTYIKLKDLILEKKSLVKETNRLRTLNGHLDYRLNEQEKRLSAVSLELQKTWHLVGKMQRQHRQLHTQEQILRYQLQQKRRLLSELKDELEYCRRKWAAARAKNDESQLQCDDLRREFAKRKLEDAHNSAESGYSDGPGSDEDDAVTKKEDSCGKNWMEIFAINKTIQRMQSTSPERSGLNAHEELRWNSAPPSVTWPKDDSLLLIDDEPSSSTTAAACASGAVPKRGPRTSRSKKRSGTTSEEMDDIEESPDSEETNRTTRIQKLEEQCKSLIAAVLETSDNRERLEVQLCHFQDEIAPVQYPIPLEEYVANQTKERMKRASSAPEINNNGQAKPACLTAREEEYTRKRSERLERLEEESRQLMNRIKRTSDKGNSLRSSIERIHSRRALSREGSFESNTEEVAAPEEICSESFNEDSSTEEASGSQAQNETKPKDDSQLLTETEKDYTARRAERLKRLEEESKLLLSKLNKNSERGTTFNSKLDALHEKYGSEERDTSPADKIEDRLKNAVKMSKNREERLRILEEEGRQLLDKLSKTSDRGSQMIDRISEREKNKNLKTLMEQGKVENPELLTGPPIPPTLKNVACTSIVSEEITERVVITQTPSQIAKSQGAVPKTLSPQFSQTLETQKPPKTQPTSKLCASTGRKRVATVPKPETATESLEEMVRRLKNLPFPVENEAQNPSDGQASDSSVKQ